MKHDKKLLKAVFAIQNPSRNKACNDHTIAVIRQLAPRGCTMVQHRGNLLIRKGAADGPHPYFLSHMDQVHEYVPFMTTHIDGNILSARDGNGEQCGVGGDDKCGIYLALMMLHELPHCTAVFVRDEEVGCCGSREVPLSWFDHAAFVIQADRNNRTMDIIRDTNGMQCASDEFMAAMLALPTAITNAHSEDTGSITDIGELASRGLGCSMVNISSGYHNPHTNHETVDLYQLLVALNLAFDAATLLGNVKWEHEPKDMWASPSGYGYGGYGEYTSPYSDSAYRKSLIDELISYGYDRHLSGLDDLSILQLERLLDGIDDEFAPHPEEEPEDIEY
jgi:putative aminopeptidase FrvX